MGEWSDFFEDFPEHNPANYVGDRFAPQEAKRLREQEALYHEQQRRLNSEIFGLIRDSFLKSEHKKKLATMVSVERCVQCGEMKMYLYQLDNYFFRCECDKCGIHGKGKTKEAALTAALTFAESQKQKLNAIMVSVEYCVQCGEMKMNVYQFHENYFSCECDECGIYGEGETKESALDLAESRIGEGFDWREKDESDI